MITFENGTYFSYDMIGEFNSVGEWIHPKRIIKSYELILVLDGTVHIAESSHKYTLGKNHLLILEPNREHYGYLTEFEPVRFYWFHFLTDIELPVKYYTGTDISEIKPLMKKLLHITNTPCYSNCAADASGYLIFEELRRLSLTDRSFNQVLAANISEYVRLRTKNGVIVSDIAQYFGYTPDYIGKYFKKACGIGLKKYIAEQKLKLAKDMLLTGDMSIKQIARELGYTEENVFIKFFTYHEKTSPASYKAEYCNTHINNR